MDDLFPHPVVTLPVLVDDAGLESVAIGQPRSSIIPLVRCVYFTFETSQPMPNWALGVGGHHVPFFMLGLSGIIFCPPVGPGSNPGLFQDPQDIESTFDAIEQSSFLVETGRVYLPRDFIRGILGEDARRHDVLRMRADLFLHAFKFAQGRLADKVFDAGLDSYRGSHGDSGGAMALQFSRMETKAFGGWSEMQLARVWGQERDWESAGMLHRLEDRSNMPF